MHIELGSGIARQFVTVLTFMVAISIGSASAAGTTVFFDQPLVSDIGNSIFLAHVMKGGMPSGSFDLVVEQRDPFSPTGKLVPTAWNAGSQTGFVPNSPSTAQLGFRNQAGTTTAQMEGDTVGAYINSNDLPTNQSGQKMMITPQYKFPSGVEPVPFASSSSVLNGELDLQVPVAVGSSTYVTADLLFVGPNGVRFSYGIKIFRLGAKHLLPGSLYDSLDNSFILNCPLGTDSQYLSTASSSASSTGNPWLGWRHFQWSISQAQFVAALKRLNAQFPNSIKTTDPTQYVFSLVHLNAEFHYSPAPAELGWSMRGLKLWLTG